MEERRRRLLLVAYDFPPIDSAGMVRVVAVTKYLRRKGWDVTVLTVRDSFVQKSESALALVPEGVAVVRTPCFEPAQLLWKIRALLQRPTGDAAGLALARRRLFEAVLHAVLIPLGWLERLLAVPDRKVGWFLPLLVKAAALLHSGAFDAVLTTSPPHSSHLPLLALRRMYKFRWVVDFRDPWTAPRHGRSPDARAGLSRRLEKAVLARADAIVANTEGNKRALLETFPGIAEHKITVITNGFDTDWIEEGSVNGGVAVDCDLVYTGHMYPHMLDAFLPALRRMRASGARVPSVWVFGSRPVHLRDDRSVDEFITFKARVSFFESLSIMRRARGLLYLLPHGPGYGTWVPSKLYPYMFSASPILALVPDGDAARILEETGTGVVVRDEDPSDVARKLDRFLAGEPGSRPERSEVALERYSWKTLVARLDPLLRGPGVD